MRQLVAEAQLHSSSGMAPLLRPSFDTSGFHFAPSSSSCFYFNLATGCSWPAPNRGRENQYGQQPARSVSSSFEQSPNWSFSLRAPGGRVSRADRSRALGRAPDEFSNSLQGARKAQREIHRAPSNCLRIKRSILKSDTHEPIYRSKEMMIAGDPLASPGNGLLLDHSLGGERERQVASVQSEGCESY